MFLRSHLRFYEVLLLQPSMKKLTALQDWFLMSSLSLHSPGCAQSEVDCEPPLLILLDIGPSGFSKKQIGSLTPAILLLIPLNREGYHICSMYAPYLPTFWTHIPCMEQPMVCIAKTWVNLG